jgi:hypothetical protein
MAIFTQSFGFPSSSAYIIKSKAKSTDMFYILQKIKFATGWMIRVLKFDSRLGLGICLFTTASRPALETTQSPYQWILGAGSLGVKWLVREANHSPPSSTEDKECVEL